MDFRRVSKASGSAAERVLGGLLEEAWDLYRGLELHIALCALSKTVKFAGFPVRASRLVWASSNRVVVQQLRTNLLHGVSQHITAGPQQTLGS